MGNQQMYMATNGTDKETTQEKLRGRKGAGDRSRRVGVE